MISSLLLFFVLIGVGLGAIQETKRKTENKGNRRDRKQG